MSKINFNTRAQTQKGFLKFGDLNTGETFRFSSGLDDRVYMKVSDIRNANVNYENLLDRYTAGGVYVSLVTGELYQHSQGTQALVDRVNVNASANN